ncbi:hypothetical protein J2X01_000471 [Arthrobacter ginsengisoli]|uniref:Uncharacterized protein n=1 Tax=Arthrobacter ginsengisoli TaxID=1356565 RepID=A0ABU1U7N3_9MICC|nr:hypothetical protein [Arthrobacter ginsengisoli]
MDATVHCPNAGNPLSAVVSPTTVLTPPPARPARLPARRKPSPPFEARPP